MDFGRINETELKHVDFTLAPEPATNAMVLKGKPVAKIKAFMGCAKWGRPDWVGSLYPLKTKEKDFLDNYVHHYNSIELNATHYKNYGEDTIRKWADKAGKREFLFCPKMLNSVTHFGSLKGKEFLTGDFLKNIMEFKEHLGPVFIQFSESFSPKRKDELFEYLKTLPTDITFFVEVRHPEWFSNAAISEALFSTLKELKLGAVITDTAGRRDCAHMHLTIPQTFIRFVGNSLHETDYTRVDEWAERIKIWKDNGLKELYFFMHMHDEAKSPELTAYLVDKFNDVCGFELEKPKIIDKPKDLFD
jgi:uncharacterized protein YecE (DUF72 family)